MTATDWAFVRQEIGASSKKWHRRASGCQYIAGAPSDGIWHPACIAFGMIDGIAAAGKDIQAYLNLLSLRQKLTASNIANADTPGYKTKDIDFQVEFAAALQGDSSPRVVEASGLAVKNDGNNVSLDREARMLSETALLFNLGVQLLKGEMEDIRKAIRSDSSAA